jgi:hypothetical protein
MGKHWSTYDIAYCIDIINISFKCIVCFNSLSSSNSTPAASRFKPLVFAFRPTEIRTTSQSKLFLFPSLSTVETTAPVLLF